MAIDFMAIESPSRYFFPREKKKEEEMLTHAKYHSNINGTLNERKKNIACKSNCSCLHFLSTLAPNHTKFNVVVFYILMFLYNLDSYYF